MLYIVTKKQREVNSLTKDEIRRTQMDEDELRSSIKFDQDAVEFLWNEEEYFIGIYQMSENNKIILKNANPTFLKIYHVSKEDFGRPISELVSVQMETNLRNLFGLYANNMKPCELNYIREVKESGGTSFWNVTARLVSNYMYNIGRRMHEFSLPCKECSLDLNYPSILVRVTADQRYKVESFSKDIDPKVRECWMQNGYIEDTKVKSINSMRTAAMLDECMRRRQSLQYMDIIKTDNQNMFAFVTLRPIFHEECTRILIILNMRSKKDYLNIKKNSEKFYSEFDEYYHSEVLGMCFMEKGEDNKFCIGIANRCMNKMMEQGIITEEELVQSSLFNQCIQTRVVVRGYIETTNVHSLPERYFVHIIPTINVNKVVRVLLVIDPEPEKNSNANQLILLLTKREREILSYVSEGYTNKYISIKLQITEGTVKRIVFNGYKKLGISS